MTLRFALPDVGEGLHEAEIVRWLVGPGDVVARDQPLVEILTDKAQVELPSPAAGTVRLVAIPEGTVVPVGTVLVEIDPAGTVGSPTVAAVPAGSARAEAGPVVPASPGRGVPAVAAGGVADGPRPKASPSTRRHAVHLGVDLRAVQGSGPGGRILRSDVDAAVSPAPAPTSSAASVSYDSAGQTGQPAPVAQAVPAPTSVGPGSVGSSAPRVAPLLGQHPSGTHPLRGIRRLTAAAMTQSWSTIPHITGMDEVDATALLDARSRLQRTLADRGDHEAAATLTPLVLLAAAVARTLRRFPLVNAAVSADGTAVTVYDEVNLGIAVATPDGLIVPVIRTADRLDLVALATAMSAVATAARARTIGADALRGGTFTITNYGALGGRFATPLILPGQAGIMGFGAMRERPVVLDGTVVARRTLPVVFSADHRIIDGDLSVAFQEAVLAVVADPLTLLLGV